MSTGNVEEREYTSTYYKIVRSYQTVRFTMNRSHYISMERTAEKDPGCVIQKNNSKTFFFCPEERSVMEATFVSEQQRGGMTNLYHNCNMRRMADPIAYFVSFPIGLFNEKTNFMKDIFDAPDDTKIRDILPASLLEALGPVVEMTSGEVEVSLAMEKLGSF